MNDMIKCLTERKSIRSYTNQEISPDCKELILRAAMEAPTAGNQQLYTILDITSPSPFSLAASPSSSRCTFMK